MYKEDQFGALDFIERIKTLPIISIPMHPRTVLWMQQRKQCETCVHMYRKDTLGSFKLVPAMYCDIDGIDMIRHSKGYCIDMREPGSTCGPEGLRYEQNPRR